MLDFSSDKIFRNRHPRNWKGSLEKLAAHYSETLCELYKQTDPVVDWNIKRREYPNKDFEAFNALQYAGRLVAELVGWAIDHQAGKAAMDIPIRAPGFPQGMTRAADEKLEELKPTVRSHAPEQAGAAVTTPKSGDETSTLSVEQKRQALCNILYALNAGLNLPMLDELIESLDSLNVGETKPLLKSKRQSKAWTKAHCMLEGLEYVEFWRAYTRSKSAKYFKDVKDAFEEAPDPDNPNTDERIRTVRRYKEQAVNHLGLLFVESRLAMARNAASNVRAGELDESWRRSTMNSYSISRLQEIGKKFRGRQ